MHDLAAKLEIFLYTYIQCNGGLSTYARVSDMSAITAKK
jgi:hypothetical protein